MKRPSCHPNAAAARRQPDFASQTMLLAMKRAHTREATLKKIRRGDSSASTLDRLLPEEACGSTLLLPRMMAALAQYTLQWFSDFSLERDYRYFAFVPRVNRLACLLYAGAGLYALLVAINAFTEADMSTRVVAICLRLGLAAAALLVGTWLRMPRRNLTPRLCTFLVLTILIAGGLLPNYLTVGSSRSSASDETFEQTISCLLGYAVRSARALFLFYSFIHTIHTSLADPRTSASAALRRPRHAYSNNQPLIPRRRLLCIASPSDYVRQV